MSMFTPFPEASWFSIDEDQYLMYLSKGYEIKLSYSKDYVYFSLDGEYHREDGPAVIRRGGNDDYYLNDVEYYTEEEYYEALKDGTY